MVMGFMVEKLTICFTVKSLSETTSLAVDITSLPAVKALTALTVNNIAAATNIPKSNFLNFFIVVNF